MIALIQKSLLLKMVVALVLIVGWVAGLFTYIDIRIMRADTARETEQNLMAFAAAIKGTIRSEMGAGHPKGVQRILDEAKVSPLIARIALYDDGGRLLRSTDASSRRVLSDGIARGVASGDRTAISRDSGMPVLSYYSPIENRAECHRCHGGRKTLNGILLIEFPLRSVEEQIAARRNRIVILAVVMIVALIASLVALLRALVYKPVRDLRDAMEMAQSGVDEPRLPISGHDELADLKRGLVRMLDRLEGLHRTNMEKEKELARNQETIRFRAELQAMFDAMQDGVLLVDRDLRIVQSNPRAHGLLPGLTAAAGRIPPERSREDSCPHHGVQKVLETGEMCEHQCSIKLPGGEQRHLHSICAPVEEDGVILYVVEVVRDVTERVRTEHELEERTAELMSANKMLSKIAITDGLTELYNRRHFDEILSKEIKRYTRKKYSSLTLMMADIDHFKKLNDKHGHLVGDEVLREVAALLREGVRATDTIARYGGEEFAIVLPDTPLDGAEHKAEKIRTKVAEKEFPGQNGPVHITISIGVTAYASGTAEDFVQAADSALYEAKRNGRNRVVVRRPGAESTQ